LKALDWDSADCGENLEIFLATQHRLEKIKMRCWRQDWRPHAEVVIPSLEELSVNSKPTAAMVLRSGGALKTLRMHANYSAELPVPLPKHFLEDLQEVTTLAIGFYKNTPQWFEAMAQHLVNVRDLTIWEALVRWSLYSYLAVQLISTSIRRFHSFYNIFLS
jgi:hypothetical protein